MWSYDPDANTSTNGVAGEVYQAPPGPPLLHPKQRVVTHRVVPEAPMPPLTSSSHRKAERARDGGKIVPGHRGIGRLTWREDKDKRLVSSASLIRERVQIIDAFNVACPNPTPKQKKELRGHLHRNTCALRAHGYGDYALDYDVNYLRKRAGMSTRVQKTIRHKAGKVLTVSHSTAEQQEMAMIRRVLNGE